jgi:hypothetical protein
MLHGSSDGRGGSIAATDPPGHGPTPIILFPNGDVPAALAVSAIAAFLTPGVPAPFFVRPGTLFLAALAPILAALIPLLLRIANADLRTAIWPDPELQLRLSQRGGADKKAEAHRGRSQKSDLSHGLGPSNNRGPTPVPVRGSEPSSGSC